MKILRLTAFLLFVSTICLRVAGQGTAFTYQGVLNNGGAPANGSYDIQFTLYTTNVTGIPLAGPVTNSATSVSNGLFTANVDFGPGVFTGQPLWLDVSVSPAGSNTFTELTPRQPITSAPYAVMAGGASNLLGALPAAALPTIVVTNHESGVNLSGTFSGNHSGTFSGNGAGLTLPSGVVFNGQGGVGLGGSFTGYFSGNGSGLTSLPNGVVFNGNSGVILSGTFYGNGSGLTSLPSFAVVNNESSVNLSGTFSGNHSGTFNGTFTGNGSGLTGLSITNLAADATLQANYNPVTGPLPAQFGPFTTHGGRLLISAVGTGWTTGSGLFIGMNVALDGTIIFGEQIYANSGNFHMAFPARTLVLGGIPAGSHTITFTARDANTTTDAQDQFILTVQEFPF
jgi:hypothetical protein